MRKERPMYHRNPNSDKPCYGYRTADDALQALIDGIGEGCRLRYEPIPLPIGDDLHATLERLIEQEIPKRPTFFERLIEAFCGPRWALPETPNVRCALERRLLLCNWKQDPTGRHCSDGSHIRMSQQFLRDILKHPEPGVVEKLQRCMLVEGLVDGALALFVYRFGGAYEVT